MALVSRPEVVLGDVMVLTLLGGWWSSCVSHMRRRGFQSYDMTMRARGSQMVDM
jgi:hypothetical protein